MIDLRALPRLPADQRRILAEFVRDIESDPDADLATQIKQELHVDLATSYGGVSIPHPFGKASGQLSCNVSQVVEDADAGVAFVVLKTVIAETPAGQRTMAAWANPETRMRVERRRSSGGVEGWTVTWKGRGWSGTLSDYCEFFSAALKHSARTGLLVVPSVKFHLPQTGEQHNAAEYEFTTKTLERVWRQHHATPLILEKDLSPTLAADSRADDRTNVLHWLRHLTNWIRTAADVRLGIKVMNALYDDDFQVEMLRETVTNQPKPDFLVVFNRLFDRGAGYAYGGWDLSDRNLRVLDRANATGLSLGPLSATGNICSGRVMVEYALRGCENGQIHTFFQVPRREYSIGAGSRSRCALTTLCLDPDHGLVPCLWALRDAGHIEPRNGMLHFRDVVGLGIR